jgi:pSer/pThr/pTyr-binding forkhead associated (FHA) protein
MAFVVVFFRGEEMDRRELSGPMVIGRAPECDLSVRDILMSRRHCRIVPADKGGWAIEDLGSKNGTRINGEVVTFAVLNDGTAIRMGNTQVKFYTGAMQAATVIRKSKPGDARRRPSDPFESLSGTVTDFQFVPQGTTRDTSKLPTPRPQPADPTSYAD